MNDLMEKSRKLIMAMALFVCGIAASQFLQPAIAQSAGGSVSISADANGSAWVVIGQSVYHCYHDKWGDTCHGTK